MKILKVKWAGVLLLFFFLGCGGNTQERFSPPEILSEADPEIAVDAAGNTYQTFTVGNQTWMAENLRNTRIDCQEGLAMQFTNGIERGPDVTFYDGQPRYAFYNNDSILSQGVIYNYSAVQHCKLCPSGYRIPAKSDWETLIDQLGGISQAGVKMLAGGESGFNGSPVGRIDSYGSVFREEFGFWWSSDLDPDPQNQRVYVFEVDHKGVIKLIGQDYRTGNYVRCIKE